MERVSDRVCCNLELKNRVSGLTVTQIKSFVGLRCAPPDLLFFGHLVTFQIKVISTKILCAIIEEYQFY